MHVTHGDGVSATSGKLQFTCMRKAADLRRGGGATSTVAHVKAVPLWKRRCGVTARRGALGDVTWSWQCCRRRCHQQRAATTATAYCHHDRNTTNLTTLDRCSAAPRHHVDNAVTPQLAFRSSGCWWRQQPPAPPTTADRSSPCDAGFHTVAKA